MLIFNKMLFRSIHTGKVVDLKKTDFTTDRAYYEAIMQQVCLRK